MTAPCTSLVRGKRAAGIGRAAAWVLLLLAGTGTAAGAESPRSAGAPAAGVRFGFFRSMFREVNENDMRASLKAYACAVATDRNILADPEPRLFDNVPEATAALRRADVDLLSGGAPDVLGLPAELISGPHLLSRTDFGVGAEYQVLVHRDSRLATVADLKGKSLVVVTTAQNSLALPWFELLVAREVRTDPGAFLGSVKGVGKTSLAVLPVFFRQAEACLVTRAGFAVMAELNPQLSQQLRVLATSPRLVPVISCFRAGFDSLIKQRIVESMSTLPESPAGRQLLTIFQSGPIVVQGDDVLAASRQLFIEHGRLRASGGGPVLPSSP